MYVRYIYTFIFIYAYISSSMKCRVPIIWHIADIYKNIGTINWSLSMKSFMDTNPCNGDPVKDMDSFSIVVM